MMAHLWLGQYGVVQQTENCESRDNEENSE